MKIFSESKHPKDVLLILKKEALHGTFMPIAMYILRPSSPFGSLDLSFSIYELGLFRVMSQDSLTRPILTGLQN